MQPSPVPRRLRVASYNVFKARYAVATPPGGAAIRPRRHDLERDFNLYPTLHDADVLALQEAFTRPRGREPHAPAIDTVATLGAAMHWPAFDRGTARSGVAPAPGAPAGQIPHPRQSAFNGVPHGGGLWGVAILCRWPAVFHDVRLPQAWWSPWRRTAIVAEIGPWIVATLHLEVWPPGAAARLAQSAAVLAAIDALPQSIQRPAVIIGDFNCQRGAPHDVLRRGGFEPAPPGPRTWALGGIKLRLDHIYVRHARILSAGVEERATGSDHKPLWCEVEAAAGAEA